MEYHGKVHGDAAEKYHDFRYLEPLPDADTGPYRFADTNRVYPDREYPRWTTKVFAPDLKTVELADYIIRVIYTVDTYQTKIQIWMQPNAYTKEKNERLVHAIEAAVRKKNGLLP